MTKNSNTKKALKKSAETTMMSGQFTSFDGTRIYYEDRGKGEPLVLVYGIACLMNHWHHQVEHLSKKFRVITFDIRGHHQSETPKDPKNLKISAIATDASYLLRHLHIKKAHFVGHSFGGQVLLSLWQQYPESVKSLTLINGFSKNPLKNMFGLDLSERLFHTIKEQNRRNPEIMASIWKLAVDNPVAMWASSLLGGFNINLTEFKDIEIYAKGVAALSINTLVPLFEDMMAFDGDSLTPTITCPTLIIAGNKDFVTPMSFQEEMHKHIFNSEFIVVPYGSHCTQLDFPDYINLKITEFVEKI